MVGDYVMVDYVWWFCGGLLCDGGLWLVVLWLFYGSVVLWLFLIWL